jgi:hypothetical protein
MSRDAHRTISKPVATKRVMSKLLHTLTLALSYEVNVIGKGFEAIQHTVSQIDQPLAISAKLFWVCYASRMIIEIYLGKSREHRI